MPLPDLPARVDWHVRDARRLFRISRFLGRPSTCASMRSVANHMHVKKATIFYSWQSDIKAACKRTLIGTALEGAAKADAALWRDGRHRD